MRGELNPGLVQLSLKFPAYFMETLSPGQRRESLLDKMGLCLTRIRTLADSYSAEVIALSVPYGPYVTRRDLETRRLLGFEVDDGALTSKEMDNAIRNAAMKGGVQLLSVTESFRAEAPEPHLYFELDGHFTARGHQLFADAVTPSLHATLLATLKRIRKPPEQGFDDPGGTPTSLNP